MRAIWQPCRPHTSIAVLCNVLVLISTVLHDSIAQRRSSSYYGVRPRTQSQAPGPNMCKVLEVVGTQQKFFTSCVAKHLNTICGRQTREHWQCCPGFRKKRGTKGCTEEKPLGNLLDTASELGLDQFHGYAKSHDTLGDELRSRGPYTVFGPSDEAIRSAPDAIKRQIGDKNSTLLLYHVSPGRLNISLIRQKNLDVVTIVNGGFVRLNKYAYGVATVNCARIIRRDQLATNGVIHTIDKVISPNDLNVTLAERVFSDGRFSQFQLALYVSGMLKTLKNRRRSVTVLAPTDAAFAKLPKDVLNRILTDASTAEKVVRRHIIKGVICADAIVVSIGLKTMDGVRLLFRCKKNAMRINQASVVRKDTVAYNGVLHAIDTVLLPDSVKKASELMSDMHLDKFLKLAREAGLNDTIDNDDITLFTPSNKAIDSLPAPYLASLSKEPYKMKRLLKYHMAKGRMTESSFMGDTSLETKAERDKIKVNIYRTGIRLDKAALQSYPRQCRNAIIHKIDKVLIPPEETFEDILTNDTDLSTFASLYKSLRLEDELSDGTGYTLIAPTNRAFERLDPYSWRRVTGDPNRIKQFLYRHIINRMVLKCSIPERGVYGINSWQGDETEFSLDTIDRVVINQHTNAVSDDQLAANGVLYKVDHVLPCSCEQTMRTRRGQYINSHRYRRMG